MIQSSIWILVLLLLTSYVKAESDSWFRCCENVLRQGRVNEALNMYQQVVKVPETSSQQQIILTISLADALLRNGRLAEAEQTLAKASKQAQVLDNKALIGEVTLRLGELSMANGQSIKASEYFMIALELANQSNQHQLAAAASLNAYKQKPTLELLQQSTRHIQLVTDKNQQTELLISLAYATLQTGNFEKSEQFLDMALEKTNTSRQRSQVLGYLGNLAEQRHQIEKSLNWTEEAILVDDSPDLLMIWQWQRGRILGVLNRIEDSISAYRQAVFHLQSIKQDVPVSYRHGISSFKSTYAPLYMALIEELWGHIKGDINQNQLVLEEILGHWEQLKTVELQDYFREACAVQQKTKSIGIAEGTAVLYPIILPDKLILITRFHDAFQAVEVPVTYQEINKKTQQVIRELYSPMKGGAIPVISNLKLYDWLLRPLQAEFEAKHIDTLVYLPDGPLRKVPLSLLNDGKHYVIEQYQVVTIPALSLLDALHQKHNGTSLLVGMSVPGPVVNELLDSNLDIFDGGQSTQTERNGKRNVTQLSLTNSARSLREKELAGELALPGVNVELKKLSTMLGTEALENESFTLDNFKQRISEGISFVHIATHGYFAGDPNKSFVMAYDHLLSMTQLSQIFHNEAFLHNPVDLVTLSACQTAEGDDRSPLGLSGVVVQIGVKSAVGTLWPVSDDAAQEFFSDFYDFYQKQGVSKAKSLQASQLNLIHNDKFKHPFYWGPFVLIGDWR